MIENIKGERWGQYKDTNYYVSDCGRVKRIYKTTERLLNPYHKIQKKGSTQVLVKVNNVPTKVSKMVYETFVGEIPKGYNVVHKDRIASNNDVRNLILLTGKELGKKYGGRTTKAKLIYDKDKDCFYRGTRVAAKALYVSRQTISDICNGKTKKPLVNIKWAEEE